MSKKMKGVASDSSFYGSFESKFKHQRLAHDYQKVKKETEVAKNKLEAMKQRKLTLLAEVSFLRQRRKHLLETKAEKSPEEQKEYHHPILQTRHKSSTMENNGKKQMKLQSKAPMLDLKLTEMSSRTKRSVLKTKESNVNRKEKNIGNKAFLRNTNSKINLNKKERNFGAKDVTFKHPSEVLHWNQKESLFVGKETSSQKKNLGFDLNQMERSYAVREEVVQYQAPVFDLNLKLGEKDDLYENHAASLSEEPNYSFSGGIEEQCRNVPNRSGKRKISWQDPVALKV